MKKNYLIPLFLLVISIIPLFIIGFYAHPCADDFSYGYYPHMVWLSSHSFFGAFSAALNQVKISYNTWQGTFSSIFFMALSPAVWSERLYFLTPIIMISSIIISHFYIMYIFFIKIMHLPKDIWITISSILCFLLIETSISPVNAFFWFNGSVHYTFMHSCMIMLISFFIHKEFASTSFKKTVLLILSVLFSMICAGANYSTALLGLVCIALLTILWLLCKRNFFGLLPLIIYFFCFYKNISAPGNSLRQSLFSKMAPIEAVLHSFKAAGSYIAAWTTTFPILLFIILLIPLFLHVTSQQDFSFKYPVVVTGLSYCLISCMLTPSFYSMSFSGPDRLINIVKYFYILLLTINIYYWIGFLSQKITFKLSDHFFFRYTIFEAFIVFLLLLSIKILPSSIYNISSYAAYVSLRSGEAQQYHQEYLQRLQIFQSDSLSVTVNEFSVKPYLLFFDDITEDPENWKNISVAQWYQKENVKLY